MRPSLALQRAHADFVERPVSDDQKVIKENLELHALNAELKLQLLKMTERYEAANRDRNWRAEERQVICRELRKRNLVLLPFLPNSRIVDYSEILKDSD